MKRAIQANHKIKFLTQAITELDDLPEFFILIQQNIPTSSGEMNAVFSYSVSVQMAAEIEELRLKIFTSW